MTVPGPRVLVIDDNRSIHDDFRKILAPEDAAADALAEARARLFGDAAPADAPRVRLELADGGREGVALAAAAAADDDGFAVAFVDMRMPSGWDGVETIEQLWRVAPDLQVVICTAYSDYDWDEVHRRLGRRDNLLILRKPFDPAEVRQMAAALARKWELTRETARTVRALDRLVIQRSGELEAANASLSRTVRALRAVAMCHHAINRAGDEAELLDAVCRAIAAEAGYRLVWIGYAHADPAKTVSPVASAGPEVKYLDAIRVTWDESATGLGPTGRAIATRALALAEVTDPAFAPWRAAAEAHGFHSSISLPLVNDGVLYGALCLYADHSLAFDERERALLTQLAEDVAHGIAARRRAAAQASAERDLALFRSLVDWTTDGIELLDAVTGRFVDANATTCRLHGYTREELLARSVFDIDPGLDAALFAARVAEMRRGESLVITARHRRADGAEFPCEVNLRLVRLDREYVVAVTRDITRRLATEAARRELEAQLAQAQKMESLGLLAGGVAHDFNNLLTALYGSLELAAEELPAESPAGREVRGALDAARRASALTRQLLAFSRRQGARLDLIDLADAVRATVQLLRRVLGEGIAITEAVEPGLPPVRADAGQVEQALLNLAINARDAMEGQGTLRIAVRQVEVGAARAAEAGLAPGRCVELAVRDSGCGIAPEVRQRIFEPFFTTKPAGRGTGLGLSMVFGMMRQLEGGIEVASAPGEGSTFRLLFPAAAGRAAPAAAGAAARARGGHEAILVVEDEAAVRDVACRILRRGGYEVLEARDGREALQACEAHGGRLGLVLSDLRMPGMGGHQLVESLHERWPALPVLLVSGHAPEEAGLPAPGGRVGFLPKPFTVDELLGAVRTLLDRTAPAAG